LNDLEKASICAGLIIIIVLSFFCIKKGFDWTRSLPARNFIPRRIERSSTDSDTTTAASDTKDFIVSGETPQFVNKEKHILAYWKQINAFETSNTLSKDRPKYEQK
jgi:hypothetical protein